MLIDTHAHLFWDSYSDDLEEVLLRAIEAGVKKILVPGTEMESSKKAVKLAKKYKDQLYALVGIHPEEYKEYSKASKGELARLIEENREQVVGIGEVGIDLYTEEMRGVIARQREMFREQAELALQYQLPLNIHTRQSMAETLALLDVLPTIPEGEFHCFSGDEGELKEALKRGFYISFCGNISWSKRVRRLTQLVPADKLLLDTDSPYMTPVDNKGEKVGERNEPANVKITAQFVAETRGVSLEELAKQTSDNATRLFRL